MEAFKRAEIWAYGMLLFTMINPCLHYPFEVEIKQEGGDDGRDKIHRLLENGKKPLGSTKYHQKCQTEWLNVWNLYEASTNFNSSNRPDASELLNMLGKVMQGGCGYTQNLAKG